MGGQRLLREDRKKQKRPKEKGKRTKDLQKKHNAVMQKTRNRLKERVPQQSKTQWNAEDVNVRRNWRNNVYRQIRKQCACIRNVSEQRKRRLLAKSKSSRNVNREKKPDKKPRQ